MKRWIALGLAVLLALLALYALWPRPTAPPIGPQPVESPVPIVQPDLLPPVPAGEILRDLQLDPDILSAAASGEHGLELRNRICKLCITGVLLEEACRNCLDLAETGRVNIDVVGTDGRPFPDHDVMVGSDCGRGAALGSGFLDLPAGTCTLTATRVEGPFNITGPSKTVQIIAGEEIYALLEIPAESWGGVGVTLRSDERGLVVDALLPDAAAEGLIPEGASLIEVDGEDVRELPAAQAATSLAGPAGTEVELRIGYEGEQGWVEQELVLERREIRASDVSITAGPPG